jgi:hypothetical protein
MKTIELTKQKIAKIILVDILIFALLFYVPTISHITSLPLYLFEPMRIMVLLSLLLLTNNKNAYFLAITLPLFSFFISGHPVFPKNMLVATELIANVFFFALLLRKLTFFKNEYKIFVSMFLSILVSKIIYYGLKYVLIYFGVLNMKIISTGIGIQIVMMIILSSFFSLEHYITNTIKKSNR